MASSINRPTARESPISDNMFNVNPSNFIRVKVAIIDVGMATADIIVERISARKRNITTIASRPPNIILVRIS